MNKVLGVLLIVAGIAAGLYVSVWVLFIGGIVDVVDGAKANPTDGGQIAWGLVKALILPEITGWIIFIVVAGLGGLLLGWDRSPRRRLR